MGKGAVSTASSSQSVSGMSSSTGFESPTLLCEVDGNAGPAEVAVEGAEM